MGNGTLEDFREVLHPEFLNHEAKDEPPAARDDAEGLVTATASVLREFPLWAIAKGCIKIARNDHYASAEVDDVKTILP